MEMHSLCQRLKLPERDLEEYGRRVSIEVAGRRQDTPVDLRLGLATN